MRLFVIFALCIEIYAGLGVAGRKCLSVKCSSVPTKQLNNPGKLYVVSFAIEYINKRCVFASVVD